MATQQGLALSCTARSLEAVDLVSIICSQSLVHNSALCLSWGPRSGSRRPRCPLVPGHFRRRPDERARGRSRGGVPVPASQPEEARATSPEDPEVGRKHPALAGGAPRPTLPAAMAAAGRPGLCLDGGRWETSYPPGAGRRREECKNSRARRACALDPAAQPR